MFLDLIGPKLTYIVAYTATEAALCFSRLYSDYVPLTLDILVVLFPESYPRMDGTFSDVLPLCHS